MQGLTRRVLYRIQIYPYYVLTQPQLRSILMVVFSKSSLFENIFPLLFMTFKYAGYWKATNYGSREGPIGK